MSASQSPMAAELLDIALEAIDAYAVMAHVTGDRAVAKTFLMAFHDLFSGGRTPTRIEVHNRMADVARNLGLTADPADDEEMPS